MPSSLAVLSRARAACWLVAVSLALGACHSADPGALVAEARRQRDHGELRAAAIELKNALQQNGQLREARQMLGEIYLEQGDPLSAEKELRRALDLSQGVQADQAALLLWRALLAQGQYQKLLDTPAPRPALLERPDALALRGDALFGLGKVEQASALYERVLSKQVQFPDALLGMARIAAAQNRPDDADDRIRRALAADPGHIGALRLRGELQRARGQTDAALGSYRQILALRPSHALALTEIAAIESDVGAFPAAHAAIAAARKAAGATLPILYADALLAYREKKLPEALAAVQQLLRTVPDHEPAILLAATIEMGTGAAEQAAQHFQKYLESHPRHAYASKRLALLHLRAGRPEGALKLLDVLAGPADDAEVLALRGEAQLQARRYNEAAALFEQASALRPREASLRAELALSHLAGGDGARAVAQLERAAQLDAASERTAILLVMAHLRRNDPDKALAAVLAMAQRADNPLVHNLTGGVYLAKHDTVQARACFEHALGQDPLYLPALANLAQLDKAENRIGDAERRYQRALERDPASIAVLEALAGLAVARGQHAQAVKWMERAAAAHPDSLPAALQLAAAYARAGQTEKAIVLARELRARHPASTAALELLASLQWQTDNFDGAGDSYAKLAALAPNTALPHLRLGQLALARRDAASATAPLRKAFAIAPGQADTQLTLVDALITQGKFAEALAVADAVQKRQPGSPIGYKLAADAQAAQGKFALAALGYERAFGLAASAPLLVQWHGALVRDGRRADADRRVQQWLNAHPGDVVTRQYYASTRLLANDFQGAIEQFDLLLNSAPDNVMALNDMAWAQQRSGGTRALEYAQRAFHLAPGNPSVIDTLGSIHLESGRLALALPLLQKAAALAPLATDIHFHLAQVLARNGDRAGARRELERLIAAPGDKARRAQAKTLLATL